MERFRIIKEIGDGSGGNVFKALDLRTHEIVAIKKMKRKFYSQEECINLRELKALHKMDHPNIIKLKEVIMENNELFFIFEHMANNLYEMISDRRAPLSEGEIRSIMSQILEGLAHMHNNGYFHRDLKPENLLVTDGVVKIADFGLARELWSGPPYTDYVSTRWYRAPEVLLKSKSYGPSIDMWSVGAILAELYTRTPLFPGQSEMDQLFKICSVLGTPDHTVWPEGMNLPCSANFHLFPVAPGNLLQAIPNASLEAFDLIMQLCSWDPQKRPTAEQCLLHPFFHVGRSVTKPLQDHLYSDMNSHAENLKLDLNLWDFDTESNSRFLDLTLGLKPSVTPLDAANIVRQQSRELLLFGSQYDSHPTQSAFWPLISSHHMMNDVAAMSAWSQPYLFNSHASSSLNFAPLQPNLDLHLFENHSFGSLAISSPVHQINFF